MIVAAETEGQAVEELKAEADRILAEARKKSPESAPLLIRRPPRGDRIIRAAAPRLRRRRRRDWASGGKDR
jgi:hypothetical protein